MAIKHEHTPVLADDGTSPVGSDEWAADHLHPPIEIALLRDLLTAHAFTNMPAAVTEAIPVPKSRTRADLTHATQARVVVAQSVVAVTGDVAIQYATSQTGAWNYLDHSSGPVVSLSTTANQVIAGSWVNLHASAKGDVYLRAVSLGGNTTEDPAVWAISLQVK